MFNAVMIVAIIAGLIAIFDLAHHLPGFKARKLLTQTSNPLNLTTVSTGPGSCGVYLQNHDSVTLVEVVTPGLCGESYVCLGINHGVGFDLQIYPQGTRPKNLPTDFAIGDAELDSRLTFVTDEHDLTRSLVSDAERKSALLNLADDGFYVLQFGEVASKVYGASADRLDEPNMTRWVTNLRQLTVQLKEDLGIPKPPPLYLGA